jgi:hypothetical protein
LLDSLGNILEKLPLAQKLHALGISWTFDRIHFCASPEEKGDVAPGSEDSEFYLAFRNVLEPPTFALTLAVLDALSTSDIAVLDLGTPVCCQCLPPSHWVFSPEDDWVSLQCCFPAVHTLQRIQFDWAAASLMLLTPAPQCPDTGDVTMTTEEGVLLPALHMLGFINTAFDIPVIIPSLMALLDQGKPDLRDLRSHYVKGLLGRVSCMAVTYLRGLRKRRYLLLLVKWSLTQIG